MASVFDDSENQGRVSRGNVDEISLRLLQIPQGHHYIILYPDLVSLRNLYSNFVRAQLEKDTKAIILIFPYYETSEKVREVLGLKGINVKEREKRGDLIIVDVLKAVTDSDQKTLNMERLTNFINQVYDVNKDKEIIVVIDMSVFHQLNVQSLKLLESESYLRKIFETRKWKGLCLYNERDLETMLTENHANELISCHQGSVIVN
jgi:DcmR-like sensory protein